MKVDKKQIRGTLNQAIGRFAFRLQKEIKEKVPRRFKNRIVVNKENNNWVVGTNDEIFKFWEYPTKPHDIKPKFKKSLKFQWPNAPASIPANPEGFHFFKKVRHPGTEGHMILETLTNDKAKLKKLFKKSLK